MGRISCERIDTPPKLLPALIRELLGEPGSFVLESLGPTGPYARWTYLGWRPSLLLKGDVFEATVTEPSSGRKEFSGPGLSCLQRLLEKRIPEETQCPVPFPGGGVGYFGYPVGRAFEDVPDSGRRDPSLPQLYWGFYDDLLALDRVNNQFWHIHRPGRNRRTSPSEDLLDRARSHREDGSSELSLPSPSGSPVHNMDRNEYESIVRTAKDFIRQGDIYQVNLSRRFLLEGIDHPDSLYLRLRDVNPTPYSGYLRGTNLAVFSSSPELFLRVRGDEVLTRPIKGTRPRASSEEADRAKKNELLSSEKDQAELHMIVDLERNDLGRICRYGTVTVPDLHTVETYPEVHHLVGTVTGTLRRDASIRDILRATFPGGSITGAPKIRAMEIIDELEPTQRQVYTGSLGWIGDNGDMELNICIRTMEWISGHLFFQVGGGIVSDSDPSEEFRETETKARGMLNSLQLRSDA